MGGGERDRSSVENHSGRSFFLKLINILILVESKNFQRPLVYIYIRATNKNLSRLYSEKLLRIMERIWDDC